MLDFSWSELILIGIVALVAIGPKELPGVLRTVGQWMGKARKMAAEFQSQFQEALREAEMADLKDSFDEVRKAASGFSGGNLISSLQKDVSDSLRVDPVDKPAETSAAAAIESAETPAAPAIEPPVTPTEPAAPTPQTFVEAETHAANEPLAVVSESQSAAVAEEPASAPDDSLKDAKAS
jgi:sec-independent protein translocase protein TatB